MINKDPRPKTAFTRHDASYAIKRRTPWGKVNPKYSFDVIKEYVESCPAAQDPLSRILIEEDAIYFGHSLAEIEASFPKLPSLMMSRPEKSFSETNIADYGYLAKDICFSFEKPIETQQHELIQNARQYFSAMATKATPEVQDYSTIDYTPKQQLCDLLDKHEVLAIGEWHWDQSSKKILIDNMAALKEKGVEAIYLEHVYYDTQKELFDAYFASDSLKMPPLLKNYLNRLDAGFFLSRSEEFAPYGFTALVMQAKRYGIRIIPIDTVASHSMGSALYIGDTKKATTARCLMMNYVAAKIYEEQKSTHKKAIFFVGSAHLNNIYSGISGITEITQAPTIIVADERKEKITANTHPIRPQVLISMKPELSAEAQQLQSLYAQQEQPEAASQGLEQPEAAPQGQEQQKQEKAPAKNGVNPPFNPLLLPDSDAVKQLKSALQAMKRYGERLNKDAPNKATAAITLAAQLDELLTQSIKQNESKKLSAEEYQQFHRAFTTLLHAQDTLFAQHRAYHKVIIANIGIALTLVGAPFLTAQLIYSYAKTGTAVGFFNQTQGQRCIKYVDKHLERLAAVAA